MTRHTKPACSLVDSRTVTCRYFVWILTEAENPGMFSLSRYWGNTSKQVLCDLTLGGYVFILVNWSWDFVFIWTNTTYLRMTYDRPVILMSEVKACDVGQPQLDAEGLGLISCTTWMRPTNHSENTLWVSVTPRELWRHIRIIKWTTWRNYFCVHFTVLQEIL
jgi:hypothetical protein